VNGERQPTVYILAGPNGAGKSTFARLFLPEYADCKEFVNADLIAAGLSPFNPESLAIEAGRLIGFSDMHVVFEPEILSKIDREARIS
jgi:predicted ABC-type ATPase